MRCYSHLYFPLKFLFFCVCVFILPFAHSMREEGKPIATLYQNAIFHEFTFGHFRQGMWMYVHTMCRALCFPIWIAFRSLRFLLVFPSLSLSISLSFIHLSHFSFELCFCFCFLIHRFVMRKRVCELVIPCFLYSFFLFTSAS